MDLDDQEAKSMPFEGDIFGGHDDYIDDDFGQLQDLESASIKDDDEQEVSDGDDDE